MTGRSGERPLILWAATRLSSIMARMSSKLSSSIFWISWDVLKPSKKWRKGILDSRVAAWAIRAKSMLSWTFREQSMAKPVDLTPITSEWSP